MAIAALLASARWQLIVLALVGLGSTVLAGSLARVPNSRSSSAWRAIAIGLFAFTIADASVAGHLWRTGSQMPFGTRVDLIYLAGYLCCIYGLRYMLPASGLQDPTIKYDLAILGAGIFTFLDLWVLDPSLPAKHGRLSAAVAFCYPVFDLALLLAAAAIVLTHRRLTAARRLILFAILLELTTDIANVVLSTHGISTSWLNVGWTVAGLAIAGAAVHPSRTDLHETDLPDPASARRLSLVGFSMLTLVVSILAQCITTGGMDIRDGGGAACVMTALVLRRLGLTIKAERAARQQLASQFRFQAILLARAPGQVLVVASNGTITFRGGSAWPAVTGMTEPDELDCWFDHVHPADQEFASRLLRDAQGGRSHGELRLLSAGSYRHAEVIVTDASEEPSVAGLVLNVRDIEERHVYQQRLYEQATTDALTGLDNRFLLMKRLDETRHRLSRSPEQSAVLLIGDLGNFKLVNDNFGHATGDKLLRTVATRLAEQFPEALTIARIGGDEFAVLIDAAPSMSEVTKTLGARVASLRSSFCIEGRSIRSDITIGTSFLGADGDIDDALWRADVAMYSAKRAGEPFVVFDEALAARERRRLTLQRDARSAIAAGQFSLLFQPVVTDLTGGISGCEALLRWQHPEFGVVPPSEFIPHVEETGSISELGRWVLLEACREAAQWGRSCSATIAVNVSPSQLKNPAFAGEVAAALRATGLSPDRLILEITETGLVDTSATLPALTSLKALGVRLAIDDFGTGYSSLSYLQRLPIDQLKIDQSFISRLGEPDSDALVGMLITLARTLRLDIVAEGVETIEQAAWLLSHEPLHMQGYLFGQPVPARELRVQFEDSSQTVDG